MARPINPKPPDRKLRCLHVFLLKRLVDDKDVEGGLMMVGTFVQRVFDLTKEEMLEHLKSDGPYFHYRFNESSDTEVNLRRIEPLEFEDVTKDGKKEVIYGTRTTLEVSIPMEIDSLVSAFPFQVNLATAAIELSSINDTKNTIRADFIIHETDPRYTIAIQNKGKDKTIEKRLGLLEDNEGEDETEEEKIESLLNKLDKTKKYEFLSPYPEVYYEYDKKKEYCPRFTLSFYVVEPGFQKLVTSLLPMILVTFLAILNTVNDWMMNCDGVTDGTCEPGEEASAHIQVTSALTLTIVFVLPQMMSDTGNRDKLFTKENVSIIVFFFALILSSVPRSIAISDSAIPELLGVIVMGCAALFLPLVNLKAYYDIKAKVQGKTLKAASGRLLMICEKGGQWKEDQGLSAFHTVGDMINDLWEKNKEGGSNEMYLASEDRKRLWWNSWD